MATLQEASRQWVTRPADQRYLSLDELKNAVAQRRNESWTLASDVRDLRVKIGEAGLAVEGYDRANGSRRELQPTNWAFGQLAQYAQAPASYLRRIDEELAAINIQWGLDHSPIRENSLVLAQSNGENRLRAMTSTSYGRIWDEDVVNAVIRVNHDDRWKVPFASYTASDPRRATTLYASDRDVFIFLVDSENTIDVGGEKLGRGFFTWNSEVGSSVFGLTTFLYRYICDNRIVWGATDVQELRIRHTGGAPDRFAYEGAKYLRRYSEESAHNVVEAVTRAKAYELPEAEKPGKGWEKWLQERGFNNSQAKSAVTKAIAEEGQARSLWDIINGVTATARDISHTDERVRLETAAGNLMKYAENRRPAWA